MDLITIRTFDNYFNASIILTRLQDAGMECYLKDEFTVTIDPLLSNAIGGIKLVVKDTDVKQAMAMLDEFDAAYRASAVCPSCGTAGLLYVPKKGTTNFVTAILSWTFSNYALATEYVYQCGKCNWESKELPQSNVEPIEE